MKLYELLEVVDDSLPVWIHCHDVMADRYDGKNSIDPEYNDCDVSFVTLDGEGELCVEVILDDN